MSKPTLLGWIQRWYESECNGDWEHQYGVKIDTIDNPGWKVGIDLFETELHDLQIEYGLEQRSDQDWVGISVTKQIFKGIGDPTQLEVILERFRDLIENQRAGTLTDYLERTYPGRWKLDVCP